MDEMVLKRFSPLRPHYEAVICPNLHMGVGVVGLR